MTYRDVIAERCWKLEFEGILWKGVVGKLLGDKLLDRVRELREVSEGSWRLRETSCELSTTCVSAVEELFVLGRK